MKKLFTQEATAGNKIFWLSYFFFVCAAYASLFYLKARGLL